MKKKLFFRFTPIQNTNYSIVQNEMKVMKSFILWSMKTEKAYKVVLTKF